MKQANTPTVSAEQTLEDALLTVQRRVRRIDRATFVASLLIVATLLFLLFGLRLDAFRLLIITPFSVFTRASTLIAHRAFLYPRLLTLLQNQEEAVQQAARAVFERHRAAILAPILRERLEPTSPAAIATVTYEQIASWPELQTLDRWRRIAQAWFVLWLCVLGVVAAVIWSTLP